MNARIHFLKDFLEFRAVELHFCGFDLVDIMAGQPTPQRTPTTHTQRNKKNKDDNESDNLRFFCCKFGRAQKKVSQSFAQASMHERNATQRKKTTAEDPASSAKQAEI